MTRHAFRQPTMWSAEIKNEKDRKMACRVSNRPSGKPVERSTGSLEFTEPIVTGRWRQCVLVRGGFARALSFRVLSSVFQLQSLASVRCALVKSRTRQEISKKNVKRSISFKDSEAILGSVESEGMPLFIGPYLKRVVGEVK